MKKIYAYKALKNTKSFFQELDKFPASYIQLQRSDAKEMMKIAQKLKKTVAFQILYPNLLEIHSHKPLHRWID